MLHARLAAGEKCEVVALDYELELELKKRDIAFSSLRKLTVSIEGEREPIEYTRRLANEWYMSPDLAFFRHEGILLGEPHAGALHQYFGALIYYFSLLEQLFALPGTTLVSIPESFRPALATADPTAVFKNRLPTDVAQLLAEQKKVACQIIPAPIVGRTRGWVSASVQDLSQTVVRMLVHALNGIITVARRPRPIKLLSTDPWSRIEPFIKNMDDVELIMTRRQEIKNMQGAIWRTRARFHHRHDFVDRAARTLARQKAREFGQAWDMLGSAPSLAGSFAYHGVSFWPIVREVLSAIVKDNSEDAVATIENTKRLIAHYGVNCILLFSSVKGYNNLIARLAERLDIPSIELQHATEVTEASHPYARLNSRYLLAYGGLTKKTYERFGVEPWRIIECGSPRFDSYATPIPEEKLVHFRTRLHLSGPYLNALMLLPQIHLSLEPGSFTSYSLQETVEAYARLHKKHLELRFLLRPRPSPWREGFYNREETLALFPGETRLVQYENMQMLLAVSDIVVSGNSTVVLEAMLMHRPVIIYLPRIIDEEFRAFEDAGAVRIARTEEDLHVQVAALNSGQCRAALVARADRFLRENFVLDGKSAERVAALIRRVSQVQ